MLEEAQHLTATIQQLETSLVDEKANGQYHLDDNELQVTYPLNRCLSYLKEKHNAMIKLHRERYEQVKSQFLLKQSESHSNSNRACRGP